MSVDPTRKKHGCNHPGCDKSFSRLFDLDRHKWTHKSYPERRYGCPVIGCDFRANQLGGLQNHIGGHSKRRLPCGEPDCLKTFSDPSSRSKHKKKAHRDPTRPLSNRAPSRKTKRSAPYPIPVHARVARHVEEHSRQDAKDILKQFATFAIDASEGSSAASPTSDASSDFDTGPSASRGASSAPSSSVYRPDNTMQPSFCEPPGIFHCTKDVQTDGWSFDTNQKLEHHQAYDANSEPPSTAWDHSTDVPVPSRSEPNFGQSPSLPDFSEMLKGLYDEDNSCNCWDCWIGTLVLAPLQGQYQEMQNGASFPNAPFCTSGKASRAFLDQ